MGFEHFVRFVVSLTLTSVLVLGQHNVIRFSEEEIKEVVKMHNDLRRSIYNAANMRELTWNEAVAMAASDWGTECEYVTRQDNQWGQNMNYFFGGEYHRPAVDLFRESFYSWSNETIHYDYRRYRSCGRRNVCSYVQLIAADAEQVGCSIVKCPRLQLKDPYGIQTHAKMVVCFYTPWVDINNKEVFIPEQRCSACPTGTVCVDNLCSGRFAGNEKYKHDSIGEARIKIGISSISGSRPDQKDDRGRHGNAVVDSQTKTDTRRHGNKKDRIIGGNEIPRNPDNKSMNTGNGEHRRNKESYASNTATDEHVVVYTPNNRVVPFPGKKEARDIRRIEKYEKKLERKKKKMDKKKKKKKNMKKKNDQSDKAELVQKPEGVAAVSANTTQTSHSRQKRQTSYEDARYLRRLEYYRYLRDLRDREIQERERRRQYEAELQRRRDHHRRHRQREMMELRRVSGDQRRQQEERERRRQRRVQELRRRQELLALLQSEGELIGEEQFFTVSAHNLLRREVGAKELYWSSHLEKWAKYVIRCETEYPGPISCFTNFGKANEGQDIYNVVYEWGAEGDDLRRPLRNGCRTPFDQSLCNHNSIIRDKSLTQMACAAKNCGLQRALTCIYSTS